MSIFSAINNLSCSSLLSGIKAFAASKAYAVVFLTKDVKIAKIATPAGPVRAAPIPRAIPSPIVTPIPSPLSPIVPLEISEIAARGFCTSAPPILAPACFPWRPIEFNCAAIVSFNFSFLLIASLVASLLI